MQRLTTRALDIVREDILHRRVSEPILHGSVVDVYIVDANKHETPVPQLLEERVVVDGFPQAIPIPRVCLRGTTD